MEGKLSVNSKRGLGMINIAPEAIAMVAGIATLQCFGVVGMSSRSLQDGIAQLLHGKENLTKGIEVRIDDDRVEIGLYVIVEYGTKINEVAHNVIENVKYTVEDQLGLHVDKVNVHVLGVRTGNKS